MPILLRGARQVGKTYLVNALAKQYFSSFVEINFELNPEYKDCFTSLEPQNILNNIKAITKAKIIPGETLLFLDEVQECPQAISSLRYF